MHVFYNVNIFWQFFGGLKIVNVRGFLAGQWDGKDGKTQLIIQSNSYYMGTCLIRTPQHFAPG